MVIDFLIFNIDIILYMQLLIKYYRDLNKITLFLKKLYKFK